MTLVTKTLRNVTASLVRRYKISAPKEFKDKALGVKIQGGFMHPNPTFPILFHPRA